MKIKRKFFADIILHNLQSKTVELCLSKFKEIVGRDLTESETKSARIEFRNLVKNFKRRWNGTKVKRRYDMLIMHHNTWLEESIKFRVRNKQKLTRKPAGPKRKKFEFLCSSSQRRVVFSARNYYGNSPNFFLKAAENSGMRLGQTNLGKKIKNLREISQRRQISTRM